MIKITSLTKIYKSKRRRKCRALSDINLTLPDTGLVFVLGKSGSGKSTLLNLIGGLDNITSGSVEVDGNDLAKFREKDFCNYRNTHIGFIFQDYHLIEELTVYDNIALSLNLRRMDDREKVLAALARVDLAGYEDRYPAELSGGEQQRVAIARAIVKKPRIILADEPTGNLDTNTATAVITLLKELSKECLILIVSHNVNDANNYADRIIELKKGEIISDKSRNPEFLDEVTLENGELVYPQGLALSEKDVDFINENDGKKIIIKKDKFLPTDEPKRTAQKVKIENKNLTFAKETRLSGKFLKNKVFAIAASSIMVSAIMVIMALAQTIIAFDGGRIVAEEMEKINSNSIYMTKKLTDEQKIMLDQNDTVLDCFPEIYESEISQFLESEYNGKIYEVSRYNLSISTSKISAGIGSNLFTNSPYIQETLGTMIVDESFFENKFGEVKYLAKAEKFHPTGVIITDYVADAIMLSGQVLYARSYESLLGEYHWNVNPQSNVVARGYINGIIYTGYKEKYADLFEMIKNGELATLSDMLKNDRFSQFVSDIYDRLGFCYSLNPNFKDDVLANPAWDMVWHYTISFDEKISFDSTGPQVRKASVHGMELGEYEVVMSMDRYNEVFGSKYTSKNIKDFVPHTVTISHYKHFDTENPLFTQEIKIVGLFVNGSNKMGGTFIAGDSIYELFAKDHNYTTGLYFDGNKNIDAAINISEELGLEQNIAIIEGIHTMTKVVDVFVPIFEIIALFLCAAVVFILVNFSTKMIKDKMHEIGILKALGTKNSTIVAVFGLQVTLIAILTCLLSTVGYYFLVDVANDVLFESMKQFVKSRVVLDLDFFTFMPKIALEDCALVAALSAVSMLIPMIKIKAIKPVKIIKAKE